MEGPMNSRGVWWIISSSNGCGDGWKDGWMHGWMDGQMTRQMGGWIVIDNRAKIRVPASYSSSPLISAIAYGKDIFSSLSCWLTAGHCLSWPYI